MGCDYCPKWFHPDCHIPKMAEPPSGKWRCCECTAPLLKKKQRCGECDACKGADCGDCKSCRNGKPCESKRCRHMRYAAPEDAEAKVAASDKECNDRSLETGKETEKKQERDDPILDDECYICRDGGGEHVQCCTVLSYYFHRAYI